MGIGAPVTPLTAARNENRYTRCEPTLRLKHAAANYVTRPAASKSDRLRRHSGRLAHTTALSSEAMSEARITRERGDFDRLLQLLAHGDRTTRLGAARQLGKLGDQRAVPPLVGCLQASDFLLRTAAAKALGEIGNPSAVEALYSTAVEDENHYVRGQAAAELFRLGDERGFVLLSKLLHEPETRSPQHWRRWMARLAVECRAPEAIPHLRSAKGGSSPWARWRLAQAIRHLERLNP
jgi:HEAT repeat protein